MPASQSEFLLDLDAFAPAAGKTLRFQGRNYTIRNFNDLGIDNALLILRAEQDMAGKSAIGQIELGLRYLTILLPEMDRATLGALTSNQMLEIMRVAMGVAQVPPTAGAAPSDLATASPLSADSTGGPGATSGS